MGRTRTALALAALCVVGCVACTSTGAGQVPSGPTSSAALAVTGVADVGPPDEVVQAARTIVRNPVYRVTGAFEWTATTSLRLAKYDGAFAGQGADIPVYVLQVPGVFQLPQPGDPGHTEPSLTVEIPVSTSSARPTTSCFCRGDDLSLVGTTHSFGLSG